MRKFTMLGEFADPGAEHDYQDAKWRETRRRMRYICVLTACAYLCGVVLDYFDLGPGPGLTAMAAGRLAAFAMGLAATLCTLSTAGGARRLGWALGGYMLTVLLVEALEQMVKAGRVETQGVPACVIIVLTYYLFLPPRVLPTLIAGLGGSLAYLATLAILPAPPGRVVYVGLFLVLVNGFGVYFLTRFGLSQRREHESIQKLKDLAEIDALTQVFNRRRALELGERALRQALRYDEPYCVLYLDLDHFKEVNDRYGHAVGDKVLAGVAARCRAELREVDIFGRLGGEEFVAFMPHSDLAQAQTAAERLLAAVSGAGVTVGDESGQVTVRVTASIGVAALSADAADLDDLLGRADQALYQAKLAGRNQALAG